MHDRRPSIMALSDLHLSSIASKCELVGHSALGDGFERVSHVSLIGLASLYLRLGSIRSRRMRDDLSNPTSRRLDAVLRLRDRVVKKFLG